MNRKLPFTLIELLVVVAIILILAGMISGGVISARKKARLAECANNLNQIGKSITMYTDDNEDFFPPGATSSTGTPWNTFLMARYLENATSTIRCPGVPTNSRGYAANGRWNGAAYGSPGNTAGVMEESNISLSTMDVTKPASTMLITERTSSSNANSSSASGCTIGNWDMNTYCILTAASGFSWMPPHFNDKRLVTLHVDGHTEPVVVGSATTTGDISTLTARRNPFQ